MVYLVDPLLLVRVLLPWLTKDYQEWPQKRHKDGQ
jgi:hypothetical protein